MPVSGYFGVGGRYQAFPLQDADQVIGNLQCAREEVSTSETQSSRVWTPRTCTGTLLPGGPGNDLISVTHFEYVG